MIIWTYPRCVATHQFALVYPRIAVRSPLVCIGVFLAVILPARAESTPTTDGPSAVSRKSLARDAGRAGEDIHTVWYRAANGIDPHGRTTCTYDNGSPLDDEGNPASQLNPGGSPDPWVPFIAAAADDFTLTGGTPGANCRIQTVRTAFRFFQDGSESATPLTTFEGVYVTVYPDVSNAPGGSPTQAGGHNGSVFASQFIPASSLLNQTLVGLCAPSYVVDIPVDITVARDVRYWLSIVPKFVAPPQSAWTIASVNTGQPAEQGFGPPVNLPFWTPINGNFHDCIGSPPAQSRVNLAFMLMGEEVPDVTGACCTDNPLDCQEGVSHLSCQEAGKRFAESGTCASFDPPCGTGIGGCCLADGVCQNLEPAPCQNAGGTWNADLCDSLVCSPANGRCENASTVGNGTTPFTTLGAVTDGPADSPNPPCTLVNQDIWFRYTADCTGMVTVSLCDAVDYDSAISAYLGWGCGPNLGLRIACDNNACGTASTVSFAATNNEQYLIRVGGAATAVGTGSMTITCVPNGSGACCLEDHTCTIETQANCQTLGGTYTGGQPCSPFTCPPPENDNCANAILMTGTSILADSRGASTDGPDHTPACPAIENDVWYRFDAPCDGPARISLCDADFDATLAVYDGCDCPVAAPLACDDNSCGGSSPRVELDLVLSNCYLVRVGGVGGATGTGTLQIDCLGACCHLNGACDLTTESQCAAPGDVFTPDVLCSLNPCPPAMGACCLVDGECVIDTESACGILGGLYQGDGILCDKVDCPAPDDCSGDLNGDCVVNDLDIGLFVDALLGVLDPMIPPCRADTNHDASVNGHDIAPFIARLLGMTTCVCCPGDTNLDGNLDGHDIQGIVNAVLTTPMPCTAIFRACDVDNNGAVELADVDAFVFRLMNGDTCSTP